MRNHSLSTIPAPSLAAVTGGCHKGRQPQQAQPQSEGGPDVQVSVATGQIGGQAIQQALSGGTPTS